MEDMKRRFVHFPEGERVYPCYLGTHTWNGWAWPFVDAATIRELAADEARMDDSTSRFRPLENGNWVVEEVTGIPGEWHQTELLAVPITSEGNTITVFDVQNGWCWEEAHFPCIETITFTADEKDAAVRLKEALQKEAIPHQEVAAEAGSRIMVLHTHEVFEPGRIPASKETVAALTAGQARTLLFQSQAYERSLYDEWNSMMPAGKGQPVEDPERKFDDVASTLHPLYERVYGWAQTPQNLKGMALTLGGGDEGKALELVAKLKDYQQRMDELVTIPEAVERLKAEVTKGR